MPFPFISIFHPEKVIELLECFYQSPSSFDGDDDDDKNQSTILRHVFCSGYYRQQLVWEFIFSLSTLAGVNFQAFLSFLP